MLSKIKVDWIIIIGFNYWSFLLIFFYTDYFYIKK